MSGSVAPYTALVTSEHNQKPRFLAALTALVQPFADDLAALQSMPALYNLDTAVGEQLDVVGQWIGPTRYLEETLTGVYFSFDTPSLGFDQGVWNGTGGSTGLVALPDYTYRLLLYATVAANHWDGTVPGAERLLNAFWNPLGYYEYIVDGLDMTMTFLLIGPPLSALDLALFYGGFFDVRPAGVGVANHIFIPGSGGVPTHPIFGFDLSTPFIAGFDIGYWDGLSPGLNFDGVLGSTGFISSTLTVPDVPGFLLMHFDGANGSTTMTDVYGHTCAAHNGSQLVTSVYEFGGSSVQLGGGVTIAEYVSVTQNTTEFDFGTGDFTIEFWVRTPGISSNHGIPIAYGAAGSTGYYIQMTNDAATTPYLDLGLTNLGVVLSSTHGLMANNVWHAVALVRQGGTFTFYIDGVAAGSTAAYTSTNISAPGSNLLIGVGRDLGATYDLIYIDELRLSNFARYTSNYTPKTSEFTG